MTQGSGRIEDDQQDTKRSQYVKPKIREYGSLSSMTRTASGTANDGGGPFGFSGGSG